jgi:hypothetical protein
MTRIPAFSAGDEATYKVALENGVTGYGTNTPPVGPAANVTYILGASPTGDWAGNAKKVACYISDAWVFLPASGAIGSGQMGLKLPAAASNAAYYFDGANWTAWAAPTRPVDLQNSIDPFPQYLMRYEGGSGPGAVAWGDITGTLSAQTDLDSALDGKAASVHTHAISDTTGLQTALDGKQASGSYAAATHSHVISDTTGLQTALDGKAASSHTHNASAIDAGTVATARLGSGTANSTTFLRGDQTWAAPPTAAYTHVSQSSGATTTGANTTPVSVTGAVFDYAINSTYRIWVMGRVNSTAATTGISLHFDLSSAVTAINMFSIHPLAAGTTGTVTGGYSIADDTSAGASSGVPAGPLDVPIIGQGLLVTGANTGTAQLRVRSETTAVTELMAGAVMVVEKLI